MKKRKVAWIIAGVFALTLTGCAGNPEKSVVQKKNMEEMLRDAETEEDSSSYDEIKEEMKKYETYQTKIKDRNLKVTVHVDAEVEIPEVEKLSVYRVSARKINQKLFERIVNTLTPEISYYRGEKEDAGTKSRLTDYLLDNKIQSIRQLYDGNPTDSFYSWLYELHGDGDVFYGLSDGAEGNYHSLFMQNSENYGNCLRYECSKYGYSPRIYHADVENDLREIVPKKEGEAPDFFNDKGIGIEAESIQSVHCVEDEPLTLSEEEAREKADKLLEQMGFDDYKCHEKGMYSQILAAGENGELYYRDIYRFLYLRNLEGVFVNNQSGFKLTDGWQGNDYVKKQWGSEAIAIAVNDNGIADFYYLSPLAVEKKVVERSRIKSFGEIKDIFEQMVVIENAPESLEDLSDGGVSIEVAKVNLVYTRISEKDSFDTGLIVPAWNFEGTIVDEWGNEKEGNILSINAIDGSVIDQRLGY